MAFAVTLSRFSPPGDILLKYAIFKPIKELKMFKYGFKQAQAGTNKTSVLTTSYNLV